MAFVPNWVDELPYISMAIRFLNLGHIQIRLWCGSPFTCSMGTFAAHSVCCQAGKCNKHHKDTSLKVKAARGPPQWVGGAPPSDGVMAREGTNTTTTTTTVHDSKAVLADCRARPKNDITVSTISCRIFTPAVASTDIQTQTNNWKSANN